MALDPHLHFAEPLRTEAEARADRIASDVRDLATDTARRVLGSLHTREAFERQGYHVPAEHLANWRDGLCDERGRPTMKAHRVGLDGNARQYWRDLQSFRKSLAMLQAEPPTPYRDFWIPRTRLNADECAANLRRVLAERRALKRSTVPVIRLQAAE